MKDHEKTLGEDDDESEHGMQHRDQLRALPLKRGYKETPMKHPNYVKRNLFARCNTDQLEEWRQPSKVVVMTEQPNKVVATEEHQS